uniref:Uncharacterized protein n=1 Tax=viral metagenome TaxID=1070528 RepID=A0A6H1ZHM9_9ZZZZ
MDNPGKVNMTRETVRQLPPIRVIGNGEILRWAGFLLVLGMAFGAGFMWLGRLEGQVSTNTTEVKINRGALTQIREDLGVIKGYLRLLAVEDKPSKEKGT